MSNILKPTLLILAAGIGSRYGSLKQLDPLGPEGQTIIDYSVYDAICAGFGKVVFVIRQSIENEFRDTLMNKLSPHIETSYVLQELENIPAGMVIHPERQKPWGTGHAVLMAKDVISKPFAVINADDFYGADAFRVMSVHLQNACEGEYAMVGYRLMNTLSEFGTVSRGICQTDTNGMLADIVEKTKIGIDGNNIICDDDSGDQTTLDPNGIVSMNFWGFTPGFFPHLEKLFGSFITENARTIRGEFYIPTAVNQLIKSGLAQTKVLQSTASWFGVTYREDRPYAVARLAALGIEGQYPEYFWQ